MANETIKYAFRDAGADGTELRKILSLPVDVVTNEFTAGARWTKRQFRGEDRVRITLQDVVKSYANVLLGRFIFCKRLH